MDFSPKSTARWRAEVNRTSAAVGLGLNAKRSTLVLAQADSIRLDMLTVKVLGFRKECTLTLTLA